MTAVHTLYFFCTIDDFSSQGDDEYHRHACDCPVLHNPLLYARCQKLNQSPAISLLRSFNKPPQRRIWSPQHLAKKLMQRSQVRLRVLARSCRWTKIIQLALIVLAGFPYCPYHAGVQAGPKICGAPVHRVHCEDQLQGPRASILPRLHGHAGLWQSPLLCGERGA